MLSQNSISDEAAAAQLLWRVKAIATKEFEGLHCNSKRELFVVNDVSSLESSTSSDEEFPSSERRKRTVSIESLDMVTRTAASPILSYKAVVTANEAVPDSPCSVDTLQHVDWSKRVSPAGPKSVVTSLTNGPPALIRQKYGKLRRDLYVGLTTKSGTVRGTLRKKFSWRRYPELEDYLVASQQEYFKHSSRNYTAEQRTFNNRLTHGLLDLAAAKGYVFEEFTFSMVRDRIRCYYKSHAQSAKKKRSHASSFKE